MASRSRPRPYGPADRVGFAIDEVLIELEDQLLERLAARGCELRPAPPWWRPFVGDLHHRIDLRFDRAGVLVEARNVPRKGPQTAALPPPMKRQVDEAIAATLAEALGEVFEGAPRDVRVSLYLPLRPQRRARG
ncbi:hypothetical protein ENSA5_30660 [Enhygromyxa salina]|uniref:Uncharacterized protein n=1 Tax=Enhygromyxa salina TaxID=215803 RepID=A0A2S9XZ98_9BACT|nr:hypothetical protein [Enhygromyxa salina]PRP98081.1 hypothetical protein ENSA5_30660 [Enhygromyxa salina]